MKTIGQLLKTKGNLVWKIDAKKSVFSALEMMAEKNIGALIVTKDDAPVGIFSERDYARKCILQNLTSRETPVSDIMEPRVICASPEDTIEEGMALMSDKHIRHLPVLENGKIIGIVSIGDLVQTIIEEQKFIIDQLTHYING